MTKNFVQCTPKDNFFKPFHITQDFQFIEPHSQVSTAIIMFFLSNSVMFEMVFQSITYQIQKSIIQDIWTCRRQCYRGSCRCFYPNDQWKWSQKFLSFIPTRNPRARSLCQRLITKQIKVESSWQQKQKKNYYSSFLVFGRKSQIQ